MSEIRMTSGEFAVGTGRGQVAIAYRRWGRDLHVHIGGGDDHVGAVAICGRTRDGATHLHESAIPPHKEGPVAREAAERLHAALGVNVAVSSGVHYDDITKDEIARVVENARAGVARLIELLETA